MNFKTPFKVLTTAALIGTLSLSAIAPGAASAASTTTQNVKAKTADHAVDYLVLVNSKGELVKLSFDNYSALEIKGEAALFAALGDFNIKYIVTGNGNVYDLNDFAAAEIASQGKDVTALDLLKGLDDKDAELDAKVIKDAKETKIEDGKVVVDETPAVEDFEVTEIAAINATSVKVNFSKAAETLAKADVTVTNAAGTKQLIKEVKLSDDKKSATVEFYDALKDGDYKVTVKDAGEGSFKFEIGAPAKIEAATTQKFATGATDKVAYKVFDANGLDITSTLKADEVTFQTTDASIVDSQGNVQNISTEKSAFVNIVVKKEGSTTELKSERVTVSTEKSALKEITDYTVATSTPSFTSETYKQNTTVALNDTTSSVYVTGKDQFDEDVDSVTAKYESLDLDVAVVDANTGKITPIKEGKFAVKITSGSVTKTVELEVVATAKLTSLALDKDSVTISNKSTVAEKLKLTAKDQNGNNFATPDYKAAYTAEATTEAGKKLVKVEIEEDGTIKVLPQEDATSGTATVEVKKSDDSTIKTTFTVKVEKAGAVADYKVSGFEAKLDQFTTNTAKTPATTTLSVIPVDANGAQAGSAVAATYIVTDKDNKEVKENSSAIVGTNGVVDASKFEVGKYTLTTKVGTVEVSKHEFEVVNTETQPTIEFTKTAITDTNNEDLFDEVKAAIKVTPGTEEQKTNELEVTGVKYVSSDTDFVVSKKDTFATAITTQKDGEANLLISEVELTGKDNKKYTVKLDSNFKLAATSTAVATANKTTGVVTVAPASENTKLDAFLTGIVAKLATNKNVELTQDGTTLTLKGEFAKLNSTGFSAGEPEDNGNFVALKIAAPEGFKAVSYQLGNGNGSSIDGDTYALVVQRLTGATNKNLVITWTDASNTSKTVSYTLNYTDAVLAQ